MLVCFSIVDSLDMNGDGSLDAKVNSVAGSRAHVSMDGKRARQQSMANRAVSLAERATSRSDPSGGGSIQFSAPPAESPRTRDLDANKKKLEQIKALRAKRTASESRRHADRA